MSHFSMSQEGRMSSRVQSSPPLIAILNRKTIAFEEVRLSTDKPYTSTAFILHGLLGSGSDWRSFSQNLVSVLSNSFSEWRIVLVDLRNHGKSADIRGLDTPHDVFNTAKDLANLVKNQGWDWPDVVMGHSMGGKVALQFAQSCACGDYGDSVSLPKQIWVLDSVPGVEFSGNSNKGVVKQMLETLQSLPSFFPSRTWLVNHMIEHGYPELLSEWIGSTLKKSGEQETWLLVLIWRELSRCSILTGRHHTGLCWKIHRKEWRW